MAGGARPQRSWEVNDPEQLQAVLKAIEAVQQQSSGCHRRQAGVDSRSDCAGGLRCVEKAAADGGHSITAPFRPGRTDASTEQTDTARSTRPNLWLMDLQLAAPGATDSSGRALLDKAQLLTLSAPEDGAGGGSARA